MARYKDTSRGKVPYTAAAEAEADQREAELISLPVLKEKKIALIKETTNQDADVEVNSVIYKGGRDSVSDIRAEIRLASQENEVEVEIWDINEDSISMLPTIAAEIARTIQMANRTAMRQRRTRIKAVRTIEIDPQGTYPTYEDAKTALDAI